MIDKNLRHVAKSHGGDRISEKGQAMKLRCPGCGISFAVPDSVRSISCPSCQAKIHVSKPEKNSTFVAEKPQGKRQTIPANRPQQPTQQPTQNGQFNGQVSINLFPKFHDGTGPTTASIAAWLFAGMWNAWTIAGPFWVIFPMMSRELGREGMPPAVIFWMSISFTVSLWGAFTFFACYRSTVTTVVSRVSLYGIVGWLLCVGLLFVDQIQQTGMIDLGKRGESSITARLVLTVVMVLMNVGIMVMGSVHYEGRDSGS